MNSFHFNRLNVFLMLLVLFFSACEKNPWTSFEELSSPPVPDCKANKEVIFTADQVTFTDLSVGTITGRTWTFEGGVPGTSTQSVVNVIYNQPGQYEVKLELQFPGGTRSCNDIVITVNWKCGDLLIVVDEQTNIEQTYETVEFCGNCWMAQNLNAGKKIDLSPAGGNQTNNAISEKYCLDNLDANCVLYGGLYQREELLNYSESGNSIQGLCPKGWHIPSELAWQLLEQCIGMTAVDAASYGFNRGEEEGYKLLPPMTCQAFQINSNDCGTSGFNGFFTGAVGPSPDGYRFIGTGSNGPYVTYYWTASKESNADNLPILRWIQSGSSKIIKGLVGTEKDAYSCRCLKDDN